MESVVIETLEQENNRLIDQCYRSFEHISLVTDFNNAKAVLLKPNLTYPTYEKGVTTRKDFIECMVRALRRINTRTKIYIGEGEGGYNSFSMDSAFAVMGFNDLEKKYPNLEVVNLSKQSSRVVNLATIEGDYAVELPDIFFEKIDFSISCPLPKVHCMTKLTLSYKNLWGCIPDTMRLKNHYKFDVIIAKIAEALKFRYAFLDGRYGLDRNGPMVGDPVEVNWFVASNSLGAFDRIVSEMMGYDYRKIRHLKIAAHYGQVADREQINLIGDPERHHRKFTLKRDFWNYPALVAFRSKQLTQLVYFSRWAKLLHDIMYTFRKRPI